MVQTFIIYTIVLQHLNDILNQKSISIMNKMQLIKSEILILKPLILKLILK